MSKKNLPKVIIGCLAVIGFGTVVLIIFMDFIYSLLLL